MFTLAEFAAELRTLRETLSARDRARLESTRRELRREVEVLRAWS